MAKKLLEGIRVIDFSWIATGPLSTKTLGDRGAEVIKVESTTTSTDLRKSSPFKDGVVGLNRSGIFNQWNTSKLSLGLNLKFPEGKEIARKLVATADIVVDNFSAGTMDKLGLGYEDLKKVKPDIIMASSSMQGQTGPLAWTRGWGTHTSAVAGISYISGWPDRAPAMLGTYTDYISCKYLPLAILAALEYRRQTGKGQYIDHSQLETAVCFMAPLLLDAEVNGRVADRLGNHSTYAAPHSTYRCQGEDRWCAIAVFTDKEWQNFAKVIGNPPWSSSPQFATFLARKKNEDELDRLIEEWTVNRSAEDVMTLMQQAGVAAGVVQTGQDLMEHDPQLRDRCFFCELEHPEVGKHRVLRPTAIFSKSPHATHRAPCIGEHNEYILKEILGMSDDDIVELAVKGVFE